MRHSTPFDPPGDALRVVPSHAGQLWRVLLVGPPGNILDGQRIEALRALFQSAGSQKDLKLITIEGEGAHFSYGASVQEHLPAECAAMLKGFRSMLLALHDSHVACHAVVQGQCLGGGLELAAFCHRVFAGPRARFAQPEISLGVIAPFASIILGGKVGRGAAEDLCISGRSIKTEEAVHMGLVDQAAVDPWNACLEYFETHMAPHSASSLRHAVRAIRMEFAKEFERRSS
jgi:cyclohexa-1,5-dienecarbonyl-CoA hydratase